MQDFWDSLEPIQICRIHLSIKESGARPFNDTTLQFSNLLFTQIIITCTVKTQVTPSLTSRGRKSQANFVQTAAITHRKKQKEEKHYWGSRNPVADLKLHQSRAFFLCPGRSVASTLSDTDADADSALFLATLLTASAFFIATSNLRTSSREPLRFLLGSHVLSLAGYPFHLTRYMCSMVSASMAESTISSTSYSPAGSSPLSAASSLLLVCLSFLAGSSAACLQCQSKAAK